MRVARGATYLFLQGLVSNLAGVVYFAFAARLLPSVADLGRVATLGMLSSLFATAGCLAIPSAVVKFVSEYTSGGKAGEASDIFWSSLRAGIVLALCSTIVCFLASGPLASYFLGSSDYSYLFNLFAIDVFLLVLWPFMQGALQGLQRFSEIAVNGIVNSLLSYGGSIVLLLFGMGLIGILLGSIIGDLFSTIFFILLTVRSFRHRGSHRLGPLIRYSAPLYSSSIIVYLGGSMDRYLILLLAGQTVLGVYSPAVIVSGVLGAVLGAIGVLLFPILSEKYGLDLDAFRDVSRLSSRYIFFAYIPLAFGIAATAYPVMTLFVGDRFLAGALPLIILALTTALTCSSVVVNNELLAMGKTGIFFIVSLLSVVADVTLAFLLIGPFGAVGAAVARASTILVSFGLPALFLAKLHGQNLDLTAFTKSLGASSLMALVISALQLIRLSEYLLPLYVIFGGLAYFVGLKTMKALGEDDFTFVRRFVPKKMLGLVSQVERFMTQ